MKFSTVPIVTALLALAVSVVDATNLRSLSEEALNNVDDTSNHRELNSGNVATTGWFSSGSKDCPTNSWAKAFACQGGYCSKMKLLCSYGISPYRNNADYGESQKFSEENNGEEHCQGNEAIVGLECSGSKCDNLRIRCMAPFHVSIDKSDCHWTPSFSEEEGAVLIPEGHLARRS